MPEIQDRVHDKRQVQQELCKTAMTGRVVYAGGRKKLSGETDKLTLPAAHVI
jgi:hypothetical protein